jgi:hypothetical protein
MQITKPTAAAVTYPLNHRATFDDITIQNNTSGSITVTITAQNVQRVASPVYSAPLLVRWLSLLALLAC